MKIKALDWTERSLSRIGMAGRLNLIAAIAVVGVVAICGFGLIKLRHSLIAEREAAVQHEVQTADTLIQYFVDQSAEGHLSRQQAQAQAKAVVRRLRFGKTGYFFVYDDRGTVLAHGANPKLEGKNLLNAVDANGTKFIVDLLRVAKAGGGFTSFLFPRPGQPVPRPKIGYAVNIDAWGWMLGSGVYVDDLQAAFDTDVVQVAFGGGLLLMFIVGGVSLVARSITHPVRRLTATMTRLAEGDTDLVIPGAERGDEIGAMSHAVEIFRSNAIENVRLHQDQMAAGQRLVRERAQVRDRMATEFEESVGKIVDSVAAAATEMEVTARGMSAAAGNAHKQTAAVSAAAAEAANGVESVATATEALSSSVAEISRQVQISAATAHAAVAEAENAGARVQSLNEAAQRIGDVVGLISRIASQTNLLALNATIEAARAGEAGKGFAVVASEVKSLANQTAKATGDIGAQIATVQQTTTEVVDAIGTINRTIEQSSTVIAAIAAAVEQQGAATREIAQNVSHAAGGTGAVSRIVVHVAETTSSVGSSSETVLSSAADLARQAETLRSEVGRFVDHMREAA